MSNPILVKKHDGKWSTDFSNLNQPCPMDIFSLSRIDQLIDFTTGHELLSFMDAYLGYNQIPMHLVDEEHTSFIIDKNLYYYKVMPFGLKNVVATYKRLINKIFTDLIGKTMEVYVNDTLVKSLKVEDLVKRLDEAFQILQRYRMRFNASNVTLMFFREISKLHGQLKRR